MGARLRFTLVCAYSENANKAPHPHDLTRPFAMHRALPMEDSDQTVRMRRLV